MNRTDDVHPDPLAGQVRDTFDALNSAGVPYVVLRGYQPIESLAESVDIDVYIPKPQFEKAANILQRVGWRRRRYQVGRYPHVFFDSWEFSGGMVRSFDVVTELCYGEDLYELGTPEVIATSAIEVERVRVPSPWLAALTFALHIALDKRTLSASNAGRARALKESCSASPNGREQLKQLYGNAALDFVDDFFALEYVVGVDVRALTVNATGLSILVRRRLLALLDPVRRRWNQFRRPVARVGVFGVDGAGKSSLIAALVECPSTLRSWSGYLGNNQFKTPIAAWLNEKLTSDHTEGIRYRVYANLRTFWWPVELIVRILIAEHRAELVLYDRYPLGQDDGKPSTIWGLIVSKYTKAARKLIPSPDVIVFLDGNDELIWSRKKEFPLDVHRQMQSRYRDFVSSLPGTAKLICTDGRFEDSLERMRRHIRESPAIQRKLYG